MGAVTRPSFDDSFGLDFHQHRRINQRAHLYHGSGWPDSAKELAMGAAHGLPVAGDVYHVHPRADHVLE